MKRINIRLFYKILCKLSSIRIIPLSDTTFLKLKYYSRIGRKLNLQNPVTFNEKLQWLKINDRKDIYTKMVDKYEAKEYISKIIGNEYIIETIGVYEKFDDINFDDLPSKFVMKCTHNSGGVMVVKDKNNFDKKNARKIIAKKLRHNYYYYCREWPYKNVKPRIIIEKYMEDVSGDVNDYKFFCFDGNVQTILVCSNRKGNFKNTDFYDKNWNLMPFTRENHDNNPNGIEKPKNLEQMIKIAEKLSKNIPFVRVDLYNINGQIYFGELTFFPSSGFEGFRPKEWDKELGGWLKLPKKSTDD